MDNGFGIWIGNIREFEAMAANFNSTHQNIKVELRHGHELIEFLDLS